MAVYGETEQTISFVVCQNGGSLAAVFCSGYNRQENIDTCDFIAAYMYEFGEQLENLFYRWWVLLQIFIEVRCD